MFVIIYPYKLYVKMIINKALNINLKVINNVTYIAFKNINQRCISTSSNNYLQNIKENENKIENLLNKYEDKILYNSVLEQQKLKLGFRRNKAVEQKQSKEYQKYLMRRSLVEPLPVSLKYLIKAQTKENQNDDATKTENKHETIENTITQFPFENTDKIIFNHVNKHKTNEDFDSPEKEVLARKEHYEQGNAIGNWMTDYENYDDRDFETNNNDMPWKLNYGTPDPSSSVSNVPCGGCGALLHCKDTAIPGYIPSEIYKNHHLPAGQHLRTLVCQRCHFLKHYDMALQVRVSPEDYPKILETIKENKKALVILMVDLLDFPCSIWPNIIDIIGRRRPIIVVGNKIDLLPQDSRGYLDRIKKILANTIHNSNLNRANIQHVSLISAKTGYGVEELITKLHNIWEYKGDVYLVGCTNVGKSSLYNVLLQSDYCKIKAVDLVQRATTSPWPGTTLNLLKFPILRPSGWRLFVRSKRLMSLNKIKSQEERLRKMQLIKTNNPKYATLIGHIEQTFTAEEPISEGTDMFAIKGHDNASGRVRAGINENDPDFKLSKWCYDTPGVIQPDQILHLLTTEELMLTLPKQLISPRTFSIKPGSSLFIAGLGRLDFIDGPVTMRVTIFASESLPVTICSTSDAEEVYSNFLGTELFQVPVGTEDRLKQWPALQPSEDIKLTGVHWETSCADVVLSSAGWVAVSLGPEMNCVLRAWTPEKRGIYVRESILAKAVNLRGRRVRFSPAYKKSHFFVN